jgi:hypothetical protein
MPDEDGGYEEEYFSDIEPEESCSLCGLVTISMGTGWFGSDAFLCISCREMVVAFFARKYPTIEPWPKTFYRHVNIVPPKVLRHGRPTHPLPYHGHEARPNEATYSYYRRMRAFIDQQVTLDAHEREPYRTATLALLQRQSRKNGAVAVPTKKLGPKAQADADARQYRQTMLGLDFPPA